MVEELVSALTVLIGALVLVLVLIVELLFSLLISLVEVATLIGSLVFLCTTGAGTGRSFEVSIKYKVHHQTEVNKVNKIVLQLPLVPSSYIYVWWICAWITSTLTSCKLVALRAAIDETLARSLWESSVSKSNYNNEYLFLNTISYWKPDTLVDSLAPSSPEGVSVSTNDIRFSYPVPIQIFTVTPEYESSQKSATYLCKVDTKFYF